MGDCAGSLNVRATEEKQPAVLVLGRAGKIPAVFPVPSPRGKTSSTRGATCRKPPSRGTLGSLCEPLAQHWLRRALRARCCGGLCTPGGVLLALPRCRMCQQRFGRLAYSFNVSWGWFAGSAPRPQSKQVWASPGQTGRSKSFSLAWCLQGGALQLSCCTDPFLEPFCLWLASGEPPA